MTEFLLPSAATHKIRFNITWARNKMSLKVLKYFEMIRLILRGFFAQIWRPSFTTGKNDFFLHTPAIVFANHHFGEFASLEKKSVWPNLVTF